MMLPRSFVESFGPPAPRKVYDTPPLVVTSRRWAVLHRFAARRATRPEPPALIGTGCGAVCSPVSRPAA